MKKEVNITNEKQLKRFLNLLPIYKSILYRKVFFQLKDDQYNISTIINALNLKKSKERIFYIHNEICDMIDNAYNGSNLCDFKCNQCRLHRQLKNNKFDGCCGNCKYKSKKGCITKNFACKMFYCSEVKKHHKLIMEDDIKLLKVLGIRQRIILKHAYFSSQDDVVNDMYIGSVFIAFIRITYRIIRDRVLIGKQ
jgi:hypothetical protein